MPPTEIPTIAELHALSDAITNEMLRLYQSGMSLTEVADAFQTTAGTVRNRIKDLPDYNPRPRGNQKTS